MEKKISQIEMISIEDLVKEGKKLGNKRQYVRRDKEVSDKKLKGMTEGRRMWMKNSFDSGSNYHWGDSLNGLEQNYSTLQYDELSGCESSWSRVEDMLWLIVKTGEVRDDWGRYNPKAKTPNNLHLVGGTDGEEVEVIASGSKQVEEMSLQELIDSEVE